MTEVIPPARIAITSRAALPETTKGAEAPFAYGMSNKISAP
jgi:hypothetical protein